MSSLRLSKGEERARAKMLSNIIWDFNLTYKKS
jgi:hypothetical protein